MDMGDRRRGDVAGRTRRDATRRDAEVDPRGRKVFLFGRHRMPAIGMSFYRYTLSLVARLRNPRDKVRAQAGQMRV